MNKEQSHFWELHFGAQQTQIKLNKVVEAATKGGRQLDADMEAQIDIILAMLSKVSETAMQRFMNVK